MVQKCCVTRMREKKKEKTCCSFFFFWSWPPPSPHPPHPSSPLFTIPLMIVTDLTAHKSEQWGKLSVSSSCSLHPVAHRATHPPSPPLQVPQDSGGTCLNPISPRWVSSSLTRHPLSHTHTHTRTQTHTHPPPLLLLIILPAPYCCPTHNEDELNYLSALTNADAGAEMMAAISGGAAVFNVYFISLP